MLQAEPMCFLIADISGYTGYLVGVELDHAHDILADLLGTVVSSLRPRFRLAELEGDAAFTFAPADRLDGSLLLDAIERCYFTFRRRRRDVRQATSCECNACVRIPDLDLKFVVHHGSAVRQRMAGRDRLVGADVVLAHRLLKSSIVERTGITAYAYLSESCVDAVRLRPAELGMREHRETYEHIGEVRGWVHDLARRWQDEEERRRVVVGPEDAVHGVELHTPASPQLVWEFATTPGRRITWQPGVSQVTLEADGNRRAVGSRNHCVHGEDVVVEEILDWRPYDYFTYRTTMPTPAGTVRFVATTELEPTSDGTIVRLRFAPPTSRKERAVMEQVAPLFDQILAMSREQLQAGLATEHAQLTARQSPGPSARPRSE